MDSKKLIDASSILTDRVRLAIMAAVISANDRCDFNQLLTELELTRGNLSAHISRLEEAGLIVVTKEFVGRKPRTSYSCTKKGRQQLNDYLTSVEKILRSIKKGSSK